MYKADIVNFRKRNHGHVQNHEVINDYNQKMEEVGGDGQKRCNDWKLLLN